MSLIVQVGDGVLRQVAAEVPIADITSPKIQGILKDMEATLSVEPDGAALAAPQIAVPLRIFVLSRRVFAEDSEHEAASKDPHFIFINPVITKRSKHKKTLEEGCLSVRGRYGTIIRHSNVTVRAYDEHGKLFSRGAAGLLAQAFQHECDHLDGTLFIDKAKETWEVEASEARD
jgi:peptide deformylase